MKKPQRTRLLSGKERSGLNAAHNFYEGIEKAGRAISGPRKTLKLNSLPKAPKRKRKSASQQKANEKAIRGY
jgi:hypothetical protein